MSSGGAAGSSSGSGRPPSGAGSGSGSGTGVEPEGNGMPVNLHAGQGSGCAVSGRDAATGSLPAWMLLLVMAGLAIVRVVAQPGSRAYRRGVGDSSPPRPTGASASGIWRASPFVERIDGEQRPSIIRDLSESGALLLVRTTKVAVAAR